MGSTSRYIADGKALAAQARSLRRQGHRRSTARTPPGRRVKAALQGADLLIYLGHGNGWPSPYAPFQASTKDGLGLNASAGHGSYNLKYYGESYLINYIRMAPHAVVILNHLCYSAGNSEPGRADPTRTVAKKRIDNFGAGFLRTGADVVFAEPRGNPSYILQRPVPLVEDDEADLLGFAPGDAHVRVHVRVGPDQGRRRRSPIRTAPGKYYRSVVGFLSLGLRERPPSAPQSCTARPQARGRPAPRAPTSSSIATWVPGRARAWTGAQPGPSAGGSPARRP